MCRREVPRMLFELERTDQLRAYIDTVKDNNVHTISVHVCSNDLIGVVEMVGTIPRKQRKLQRGIT